MMERPLNDLAPAELSELLAGLGSNPAWANRLLRALHAPGSFTRLPGLRGLGAKQSAALSTHEVARLTVLDRRVASDGFAKYLFSSPLGDQFEAVRIPIFDTQYIVCISSQVGCALGCAFCLTGTLGFSRNLRAWEMVEQVRLIRDEAKLPIKGAVFMGMGEPLLNEENVLRAARLLSSPGGLQIAGKNITISTAGVAPAIRRYTARGLPYRLIFSIASAEPGKRLALMPIERTYPLPELIEAIREYSERRRERATLAYVAISGHNTGREDAEALARAFEGIPLKLDLIDVHDPSGQFQPPSQEELARFRDHLQILRAPIARRYSGGKEIGAACGNLALKRDGGCSLPREG